MKEISAAFVRAQKAFGPALKTNTNPHFRSKYADLSACVEAVIDALNANGIGLMQQTHESDAGVIVETCFIHESGEMLTSGRLHVPASKNDPQGYGSALTYARRYSLMAACGIAPEDDDGNAASKPKSPVIPARPATEDLGLDAETIRFIDELAVDIKGMCDDGLAKDAILKYKAAGMEGDMHIAFQNKIDSKTRTALRKAQEELKKGE